MSSEATRSGDEKPYELRYVPAVEKLLEEDGLQPGVVGYPRQLVVDAARHILSQVRQDIIAGGRCAPQSQIIRKVKDFLNEHYSGFLTPVINATGVILHTNLGRAPLSQDAASYVAQVANGYYCLEYDLASGERGQRLRRIEGMLCLLTGAEAALIVNNNAAAVLLVLASLARGKEVIVSRGELVQIGGGFRLPEIMAESGAILQEVGTTNQTFIADYEQAITQASALILKVHRSNFMLKGFVREVGLRDLVSLGTRYSLPVVYDLGSGALLETEHVTGVHEPMVTEALKAGVDLVLFSGDKLLGGPQAGIILGSSPTLMKKIKTHPLMRTWRLDRLRAAALEVTLKHYLDGEALSQLPVWQMLTMPFEKLAERASAVAAQLQHLGIDARVIDGASLVGGGSLPEATLPSRLVAISVPDGVEALARRLRLSRPALVGRIEENDLILDLRTVSPQLDSSVVDIIIESYSPIIT